MKKHKKDHSLILNLISEAPGHFYWKDINGVCRGANNAQAIFLGYKSGKDLIGKTDFDFFSKKQADFLWEIDKQVMQTGKEYSIEETVNNHQGEKTIFFSRKIPLYDPETKKIIGVIGTSLDITEQKQAHLAKQAFLQNMAHDLRTPLAGIIGLGQLQEMGHLNTLEEAQEYGKMIHGAGNQLLELLNAVIETIDSQHMSDPVQAEPLDLSLLANELEVLITPSIISKKITFRSKLDNNLPLVLSDRIKLKRILINLLSNAVKFTKAGEISLTFALLSIENNQAQVEISVMDTGIGIAKDKLNKIFERFYRAFPSFEGEYSGYGLGLYLVDQGLKELNGQIKVSSQEGKGSQFILNFTFPVVNADDYKEELTVLAPESKVPTQCKNKGHILIAEDNYLACLALNTLLGEAGYQVTAMLDGESALKALKNTTFQWALLDIGLPKLKGTEVCKQYRAWEKENNKPPLPIFVLTGHSVEEVGKECEASGINQTFTKPFTNKILQDIQALVNKK